MFTALTRWQVVGPVITLSMIAILGLVFNAAFERVVSTVSLQISLLIVPVVGLSTLAIDSRFRQTGSRLLGWMLAGLVVVMPIAAIGVTMWLL